MASRYVFTVHAKTKWAIIPGASFMITFCNSDSDAIAFAEWIETNVLPNGAKLTVSKTLRLAPSAELPDPADLSDVLVNRWLCGSSEHDTRITMQFQSRPGFDPDEMAGKIAQYCCTEAGDAIDRVYSMSSSVKNIVAGGIA